ncbi:MAG: hypothetical protein AABW59_03555 [archaeon]
MIEVIGLGGMAIILVAFMMNEFGKWDAESFAYDMANLVGGLLLAFYAFYINSLPFLFLNAVWAIVAARDVVIDLGFFSKKKRHSKKRN